LIVSALKYLSSSWSMKLIGAKRSNTVSVS
jgi:hypothetical protein